MHNDRTIPEPLKRKVVDALCEGQTYKSVYDTVFHPEWQTMEYQTFRCKARMWRKRTLLHGTYPAFTAHGATVQVDYNGNIKQAWIKQHKDIDWDEIAETLKTNIEPFHFSSLSFPPSGGLLEIPLFDLHFGIASLSDYMMHLQEIMMQIKSKQWGTILFVIGQDLLHNNDLRGHTAKGTPIDDVDIPKAWADAWQFYCQLIEAAGNQGKVKVIYSKGNHDECLSWAFCKCLQTKYPDADFDLDLKPRKCFTWQGCFIGVGHCEYTKSADKLFRDFVTDFATEFSSCEVREIHAGHFHSESQDPGIMIRRLSTAVPETEWGRNNGFFGSHKRFQLFEFAPGRLKAIYYI